MGADKATLDWGGRRAIDRVADCLAALSLPVLVAGGDYGFPFVADPAPRAGPVAGLLTALAALTGSGRRAALVLAVDAPTIGPADLAPLLAVPSPGAAYEALPLPLFVDLAAAPALPGDASLRRFVAAARLRCLPCPRGAESRLRGANTPEERAMLLREAGTG